MFSLEGVEAMNVCQDIDSRDVDSPLDLKDEGEQLSKRDLQWKATGPLHENVEDDNHSPSIARSTAFLKHENNAREAH